jgi:RNA polymerase sigma factor (sigma-70 family)
MMSRGSAYAVEQQQQHPQRFMTTHWSVVLAAADASSPDCDRALATLCKTYWYPLYAFVRRQGHAAHEAEDLTQEFFARILEKQYLDGVGPEKGRFRTFLLVCLRRFLANEWDRQRALKRGGGRAPLSIDFADADARYRLEPAHELTAERLFERRWALTLLEQVLAGLAAEMRRSGKGELFDALKVYLAASTSAPPHADVAGRLNMTEGAVKVAVHRLRGRYRQLLREEIAKTVGDEAEVEEEIGRLFAALA